MVVFPAPDGAVTIINLFIDFKKLGIFVKVVGNENCKNHPSVFYLLMLRRAVGSTNFVAADFNPPKTYRPFH
ncbi:MAG: hypothetical protein U5L45_19465 [Saprospiraceae bacterium]|nr:hypothetical protein [Saprospiraceae bacterium]